MGAILIISPNAIFPQTSGNRVRIKAIAHDLMRSGHKVSFFSADGRTTQAESDFFNGGIVTNKSTSFPKRALYLGSKLLVGVASWITRVWYLTMGLNSFRYNRPLIHYFIPRAFYELRAHLKHKSYDVVIINYAVLAYFFRLFPENTRKIIDSHDILSDRYKHYIRRGMKPDWYSITPKEEVRALNRSDTVWAITGEDKAFFEASNVQSMVKHVPQHITFHPLSSENTQALLFVASRNPLNLDGLNWFLNNVWTDVRRSCPEAKIYLSGSICQEIEPNESIGLNCSGTLRDISDAYRLADICINPMRVGTGLKIKSLEAIAFGKVLITTTEGLKGIETSDNQFTIESDDPAYWVQRIVQLLTEGIDASSVVENHKKTILSNNETYKNNVESILS